MLIIIDKKNKVIMSDIEYNNTIVLYHYYNNFFFMGYS